MTAVPTLDVDVQSLAAQWGWFAAFGAMLILLGALAVARSAATSVASMQFLGALLLAAAMVEVAAAVWSGRWAGIFQHLVAAILFGVVGMALVLRPAIAAEVVTLLVAFALVAGGLFDIVGSAGLGYSGWGWQAADGAIGIALGLMILFQWPASGLRMIGVIVGLYLVLFGAAWVAFAWGMRGA